MDSDESLESLITDCQNQYTSTMEEWESTYPIKPIETLSRPFWKDTNEHCLVIPSNNSLKRQLLQVWHDGPTARHPGRDETVRQINHEYYWPSACSWI